ncbi:MAG: ammonium transporter [Actinomycetota bacterium]
MNSGDTAWILASAALVMFMTPGLALFYGGLVRSKNVLGTIMQSFFSLGLISIVFMMVGYTLAFGTDIGKVVGGLDFLFLKDVGAEASDIAPTIPHSTFMIFQLMFAVITPALITGAFAERMKFKGYVVFITLWSIFVYSPVAHWVWGGGWLGGGEGNVGALDFAGGTVVHINAGVAALAAAIYLGKRKGYPQEAMRPHNAPMVVTGAAILWFGWFGFNGGSALAADGVASGAFVATQLGAAAGMLGWLLPEWMQHKTPTTVGAATGAVGGLVAITPAAGFVEPWAAVVIGLVAGMICYAAVSLKPRLGYDDSLDVVGVHFVGGLVGALLTGVFATTAVNAGGADGLLYGNPGLVVKQVIAVVATSVYSLIASLALLFVADKLVGLRVSEDEEQAGLDLSQHAETAYIQAEGGGTMSTR